MSWKPKQGEMIIVWNNTGIEVEREFIAMTPDNKYISYTKNKHDVSLWEHAAPINKFKELKKCYELGAKFEYRFPSKTGWSNCLFKNEYVEPKWFEDVEYRIKGGIEPENFLRHYKEIIAWWDGAKIERYDNYIKKWKDINNPEWFTYAQYRVKKEETPKTVAKYRYLVNEYLWAETKYFHTTAWDAQVQESIDTECIEIPNTRIKV